MIKIIFENKKLLNEIKMEQVLPRFESKAFLKAIEQRRNKLMSSDNPTERNRAKLQTPEKAKELILSLIPSDIQENYKPEILNWIITTFIKTTNLKDIKKDLEIFYQIKEAKVDRILKKKDIYSIEDYEELTDIVNEAKPSWEAYKQSKADKDADAGSNKIYEDDNWVVYIPENKGAACKLGKGTDWCTAAPGLEYYKQYHTPNDPLIIFISKEDPEEKYQFNYGSKQFMDKKDKSIKTELIFYKLNNIVKKLSSKLPPSVMDSAKDYGCEELPNGGYKIQNSGSIEYFNKNGKLHREDGPAKIYPGGRKAWFINGKLHREDGPAEIYSDGTQFWFLNGERHREDGPAIIHSNGYRRWYLNDKLHREDGPAIIYPNGTQQWYLNSTRYSKQGWEDAKKRLNLTESKKRKIIRIKFN